MEVTALCLFFSSGNTGKNCSGCEVDGTKYKANTQKNKP